MGGELEPQNGANRMVLPSRQCKSPGRERHLPSHHGNSYTYKAVERAKRKGWQTGKASNEETLTSECSLGKPSNGFRGPVGVTTVSPPILFWEKNTKKFGLRKAQIK